MLNNLTQRQLELLAEALELMAHELVKQRADAMGEGLYGEAIELSDDIGLVQDMLDDVNSSL